MSFRKSYFKTMAKSNSSPTPASRSPRVARRKVKWVRYLVLLIFGYGLYHIMSGPSGAMNILKLKQANAGQRRELDSLTQRKAELEVEKVRLQKDSAYIERVARKELGMAKPGEKVFRFMVPVEKK
jgi:cell division protein FtsB